MFRVLRDDLSRRQHSIFIVYVKIQRGGNLTETNRASWVPPQEPIRPPQLIAHTSKTGRLP